MTTGHTGGEPRAIGAGDRELAAGDVVGEYVVKGQIGAGGFGTVYLAAHPVIGKQVAIKVLSRRYSADEGVVQRFVDEAKAVNQIRHRNIIDIFSFGQLPDGRHYYVMEYLDGTPLDQHLAEHGRLSLEAALPILRALARALDAAHAKGIAHRDLKPENVVLTFDDEGHVFPKLLDFGIAKLSTPEQERAHRTGTGVPLGTPYYMSPEQCRGRDVDHRTDIYSFGVLAFRLLTGDYPFHGELIEILHKHMHEEPPLPSAVNPQLSPEVDRAIAWMMAKDAAARPPSLIASVLALQGESNAPTPALTPSSMRPVPSRTRPSASSGAASTADTLAAAATGDTIDASRVPSLAPAPRRSRTPLVAALALVLVGGAVAGALVWRGGRKAERNAERAARVETPAPMTPTSEPTPPPAPAIAVEPVAPVAPALVTVSLSGAPEGTEVKMGATMIGAAPKVQLPRGTSEVVLTLLADGYKLRSVAVIPDRDQEIDARMKPKGRSGVGGKRPNSDDIIHKIPGLTE